LEIGIQANARELHIVLHMVRLTTLAVLLSIA
jgi:hypothetical protein